MTDLHALFHVSRGNRLVNLAADSAQVMKRCHLDHYLQKLCDWPDTDCIDADFVHRSDTYGLELFTDTPVGLIVVLTLEPGPDGKVEVLIFRNAG
jgi:hypothetical protein